MALIWPEFEQNYNKTMEKAYINRYSDNGTQTLGEMLFDGNKVADTLELPWKGNANRISCIPKGVYKVIRRKSAKYGNHFYVTGTPGRSYILIHSVNYYHDLLGCIGVGNGLSDIDGDKQLDIINSKATMKKLLAILPQEFDLVIS